MIFPSLRPFFLSLCLAISLLTGCKEYALEYGEIDAQFHASSIAAKGKPYLNKKVTVKGTITKRMLDKDSGKLTMVLDHHVHCVWYGSRTEDDVLLSSSAYQVGTIVYFDGFLIKCEPEMVLIDPVHGRDPSAPFSPVK